METSPWYYEIFYETKNGVHFNLTIVPQRTPQPANGWWDLDLKLQATNIFDEADGRLFLSACLNSAFFVAGYNGYQWMVDHEKLNELCRNYSNPLSEPMPKPNTPE